VRRAFLDAVGFTAGWMRRTPHVAIAATGAILLATALTLPIEAV